MAIGKTRFVSVDQLIAAIENNGYKQTTGTMIRYADDGSIKEACATGIAALNLGVDPDDLYEAFNKIKGPNGGVIGSFVVGRNDDGASLTGITAGLKAMPKSYREQAVEVKRADFSNARNYRGVTVLRGAPRATA